MLNDKDNDQFEGQEESEYHFSDDDISYEVEPEASKTSASREKKPNPLTPLLRSRRTWIFTGIFVVLVFAAYKVIVPSSAPTLEIAAAPAAPASASTPAAPVAAAPIQAAAAPTPEKAAPVSHLPPAGSALPNAASAAPAVAQAQPATSALPPAGANLTAPAAQPSPAGPVIPVGSTLPVAGAEAAEARAQSLTVERDQLMAQLQAEYVQKINDYSAQNKALQDQLQTLNERVTGLETQLNQVLQAMSHQTQTPTSTPPAPTAVPAVIPQNPEPKISLNVQAIIPGRAWLKSESGDTITVAEGDVIKEVGRVTKIDPYDGIVEINTGNKTVSLSYGNTG